MININNQEYRVGLWDTVTDWWQFEDCHRQRPLIYPQTDVFLICVSVVKKGWRKDAIKENIIKYYQNGLCKKQIDAIAFVQEVQMICGDDIPCILVGTKSDLRDNDKDKTIDDYEKYQHECWTKDEMKQLQLYCNCIEYIECSALKGTNVEQVFELACKTAIQFREIRIQRDKLRKQHNANNKDNKSNNCRLM